MYNKNNCKIYNVTNPELVSWEELVKTCGCVMEKEPIIKNINTNEIKLEVRSYFPFRDVTYILKIDELIKDGLYLPNISLKEGLGRAYKCYIEETPNIIYDLKMDKVDELI